MNDAKNIFIAWLSAGSPLLAAAASETGVTLLSAIVLPVLFFAIGKTVDVLLQIYLTGRNTSGSECAPSGRNASVNECASSGRNASVNERAPSARNASVNERASSGRNASVNERASSGRNASVNERASDAGEKNS